MESDGHVVMTGSPLMTLPELRLHAAAATGNIGLTKYAISHGQPINSVIDGILSLHAACSGGNDMVIRLLIVKLFQTPRP